MEQYATELMRQVMKVRNYAHVFASDVDAIWALDLAEMREWAGSNDGNKYILCCVDVFSRYAWCRPIKTKTAQDVWTVFADILKEGVKPGKIWVDQGGEFYNAVWTRELAKLNISRYSTYGTHKASIVERFIRTLKHEIWFQFLKAQTRAWTNTLEDIMKKYNSTLHHGIHMTPTEARQGEGRDKVMEEMTGRLGTQAVPKFTVGDWVCISRWKGLFEKGFHPNWSYEIYKITAVKMTDPVLYSLADYYGEEIKGTFYERELQSVGDPDFFPVEKVLRQRRVKGQREVLAKLMGYTNPVWMPAANVGKLPEN